MFKVYHKGKTWSFLYYSDNIHHACGCNNNHNLIYDVVVLFRFLAPRKMVFQSAKMFGIYVSFVGTSLSSLALLLYLIIN